MSRRWTSTTRASRPSFRPRRRDLVGEVLRRVVTCGLDGQRDKHLTPIIKRCKEGNKESGRRTKKVSWVPEEKLVSVKRFRMTDEPNAREPSKDETEKYSKEERTVSAAPAPVPAVPQRFQENRHKEMLMEKANMDKIWAKEKCLRKRLQDMQVDASWVQPKGKSHIAKYR